MVLLYPTMLKKLTQSMKRMGILFLDAIDKELKKILGMETLEIMGGFKPEDIRYQKHHMPV